MMPSSPFGPGHPPPRSRPPWWPHEAPWPPRRNPVRILVRVLLAIAGLALFAMVLGALTFHGGGGGIFLARALMMLLLFVVLVGALFATFGARRLSGPIGDLLHAARRVEAGDYAARVSERPWGPPQLRDLSRAFNTMAARLEADEAQRRRLLADTSHELRTPLTVLQGEIEAMLDGVHEPDPAHLELVLGQTQQMARLIDDLRTLALAEAGTLQLHREPTSLVALAQDAAAAFETTAARASLSIAVEASASPVIDADPVRLRQVLDNLLANAIRYAPPGTVVTIEIARDGPRARVAVIDRGPGIPSALLPVLFERFRKSDKSKGSGLGLAIARRLIEAHGGTIRADSSGAGTRIEATIPVGEG